MLTESRSRILYVQYGLLPLYTLTLAHSKIKTTKELSQYRSFTILKHAEICKWYLPS